MKNYLIAGALALSFVIPNLSLAQTVTATTSPSAQAVLIQQLETLLASLIAQLKVLLAERAAGTLPSETATTTTTTTATTSSQTANPVVVIVPTLSTPPVTPTVSYGTAPSVPAPAVVIATTTNTTPITISSSISATTTVVGPQQVVPTLTNIYQKTLLNTLVPAGGVVATLYGKNLAAVTSITIGNQSVPVSSLIGTTVLQFTSPQLAPGTYNVTVANSAGVSNSISIVVNPAPVQFSFIGSPTTVSSGQQISFSWTHPLNASVPSLTFITPNRQVAYVSNVGQTVPLTSGALESILGTSPQSFTFWNTGTTSVQIEADFSDRYPNTMQSTVGTMTITVNPTTTAYIPSSSSNLASVLSSLQSLVAALGNIGK